MPIVNPDFPLSLATLGPLEARLRANPVRLERPVVILGGWRSPRVGATWTQGLLCPFTSNNASDFLSITYPWASNIEAAADAALKRIRERFGGGGGGGAGGALPEFDFVCVSMGGVVARMLLHGLVRDHEPETAPVRARRVFTLASPHRGARFADFVAPDRAARALKGGSSVLKRLDELLPEATYELHCYALLRDWLVGAGNTAPPGMEPRWLDPETTVSRLASHYVINRDRRVIADIALRLRGEEPIARAGSRPPRD